MSELHDAYGHVALPRFLSADEYLKVMDEHGVGRALVCTAETCPDLNELSRAACRADRFRVAGLPLGATPEERLDGVKAQLDSGFVGVRIGERSILDEPALLEAVGTAGGIVLPVGSEALLPVAELLHAFLERFPAAQVVAPHFASGGAPDLFAAHPALEALFRHPRFAVVFSRHGMFDRERLLGWAAAVVARCGWSRVLWGSEYPVALYRDETYASTADWIDGTGLNPTAAERRAYLHDNAARLLFGPPRVAPTPLADRWCRMELKEARPVWLFPHGTLDVPEEANRKLLEAYLAAGGDRAGSYRAFVARRLAGG